MTYKGDIEHLSETYPDIANAFGGLRTLEEVFKWIRGAGDASGAIDVIAQDEFSHDFVLELPELKRFAAFGVT